MFCLMIGRAQFALACFQPSSVSHFQLRPVHAVSLGVGPHMVPGGVTGSQGLLDHFGIPLWVVSEIEQVKQRAEMVPVPPVVSDRPSESSVLGVDGSPRR